MPFKSHCTALSEYLRVLWTPPYCSGNAQAQLTSSYTRIILRQRRRGEGFRGSLSNNWLASYQSAIASIVNAKTIFTITGFDCWICDNSKPQVCCTIGWHEHVFSQELRAYSRLRYTAVD